MLMEARNERYSLLLEWTPNLLCSLPVRLHKRTFSSSAIRSLIILRFEEGNSSKAHFKEKLTKILLHQI